MIKLPEIQAGVREAGSIPRSLSEKFKVEALRFVLCNGRGL